ncbi:hypothetical protein CEE45_01010 [Candidatus Heimdallarchaeota archaeon B3_Heim]|nr:MAG: hypothetical protein CEE45_01010 [Candidatus Heimdallarchaeota archaeon B3_Heim]
MAEINKTTSAFIILAIFISYPFASASLFGFLFTNNSTNFSIYNTGWNGASTFKDRFIEDGAQISTIVGSSNVLNRLNQSELGGNQGSLIILGPSVHYDPTESLAILMYAINGGRVIIADDFGTGNDILSVLSIFLGFISEVNLTSMGFGDSGGISPLGLNTSTASQNITFPIAGIAFNGSLLADQGSYDDTPLTPIFHAPSTSQEGTTYKMPAPWVTDFTVGLSGNGVIGNFASIITMKVRYPDPDKNETDPDAAEYITKWVPMGEFPASAASAYENLELPPGVELPDMSFSLQIAVLYSSTQAWLESDISAAKANVNNIAPNQTEWANPNVGFPVFVYFPFPLGGQIILCSDPSIFINQYLDTENEKYPNASRYDNSAFADNVVRIMMNERPGQTIIFDEGHLANSPFSPIFPLSLYLKFLNMITMFPLFAIFLVPITLILSRKFIPRKTQAKPLLLTRVERYYGRSFFAVKMRWFLEYRQYSRGLELIFRRLKRNIIKRYSPEEDLTPDIIATYLINEFPETFSFKNLMENFSLIETIIESRSLITEEEFLDHYFFLKNVGSVIS